MWLVDVLFNRIGLGFGLGDDLLRLALKILVDGCCNPSRCGVCVMEWGSVKGVVLSSADGVGSVEVGLKSLIGSGGKGVGCCVFLYLV